MTFEAGGRPLDEETRRAIRLQRALHAAEVDWLNDLVKGFSLGSKEATMILNRLLGRTS